MAIIETPNQIKQLGTILTIWAHPDDESFCCAGIIAAAVNNGQTVVCLTATKGEAGVQDENRWPADKLGDIRARELEQACKILGIDKRHWLGYRDGHCHEVFDDDAADKIRKYIDEYKPDTILTFGPDGMTGHSDHQAVSRWAGLAAKDRDITIYHVVENEECYENYLKDIDRRFNLYFNIDKPPVRLASECDIAISLTPELTKLKCKALLAMPSQTEAMFSNMPPDYFEKVFTTEFYVKAA